MTTRLYPVREAADLLGLSRQRLYVLLRTRPEIVTEHPYLGRVISDAGLDALRERLAGTPGRKSHD